MEEESSPTLEDRIKEVRENIEDNGPMRYDWGEIQYCVPQSIEVRLLAPSREYYFDNIRDLEDNYVSFAESTRIPFSVRAWFAGAGLLSRLGAIVLRLASEPKSHEVYATLPVLPPPKQLQLNTGYLDGISVSQRQETKDEETEFGMLTIRDDEDRELVAGYIVADSYNYELASMPSYISETVREVETFAPIGISFISAPPSAQAVFAQLFNRTPRVLLTYLGRKENDDDDDSGHEDVVEPTAPVESLAHH